MPSDFQLSNEQAEHLALLKSIPIEGTIELCKASFDYLINGENRERYELISEKHGISSSKLVQRTVEALISFLIDATKCNASEAEIYKLKVNNGFTDDVLDILIHFVTNRRNFVESSIKSANIRAYRLVNVEWRLEVCVSRRTLLQLSNISVTMKLYLHTEPKNENRDLLGVDEKEDNEIHPEERLNRKDLLVQTDLSSLSHIIRSLENALLESKTRRIRNIVNAIH